jgi:hypothetical protein
MKIVRGLQALEELEDATPSYATAAEPEYLMAAEPTDPRSPA